LHERQQATTYGNIRLVHVQCMEIIDAIDKEIALIQRQQVSLCKKKLKEAGAFSCFRENVANPIQKRVVYVRAWRRRGPTWMFVQYVSYNQYVDQVGRL